MAANHSKTVAVTGGTGFVGRSIVSRLGEEGHPVRVVCRHPTGPHPKAMAAKHEVEVFPGSVAHPETLQPPFQGAGAVIHLVGIISEIGEQTFEKVHVDGTRNVIDAARRAGIQRIVHMSALGSRPNAPARYHRTKWEAEELVRRSGLSYTIFRPSLIYGPGDGFVNLFSQISRWSPIVPILANNRMQPVRVEDVTTCFVQALTRPETIGQTYDVGGPETLHFEKILQTILEVTGRHRVKWRIPHSLAYCQAATMERLFPVLLRKPPLLNRDQLLMLRENNTGNPEPARQLFGLPNIGFREGIQRFLAPH